MTREEAWNRIDAIIARHEIDDDYVTITSFLDYDALRMARKALEQEPSGDLISKQEVLYLVANYDLSMGQVVRGIHALPSVKQEPKTGHWIYDRTRDWDGECKYECSECGMGSDVDYAYCMRCGAKMVEPQKSEDKE